MVKKLGVFGPRNEIVEALQGNHQGSQAPQEAVVQPQTLSVGSTDWTPDQAEQYIDWRLANLDGEIANLRAQLDDRLALRKRWLSVTGGRSKIGNGIGNGNGTATGNGSNGVGHSQSVVSVQQ
jgi:hypothetical protein